MIDKILRQALTEEALDGSTGIFVPYIFVEWVWIVNGWGGDRFLSDFFEIDSYASCVQVGVPTTGTLWPCCTGWATSPATPTT